MKKRQRGVPSVGAGDKEGVARFAVVGVGASAGGLAACKTFFSACTADCGMAFVLIHHTSAEQRSEMGKLLAGVTALTVKEAQDGVRVEPNHLYTLTTDQDVTLEEGVLRLTPPQKALGHRLPIDLFFRSLAMDQQEWALGVILSGAGTDGALGIRAIKSYGGVVLAQRPQEAEFDGMPRSVVETGLVDYVLPVEELPLAIRRYAQTAYLMGDASGDGGALLADLNRVLGVLHARLGCNFRAYKRPTLLRRVQRRMGLRRIESMAAYAELLRSEEKELQKLYADFLIGVTQFFRDAAVWEEAAHSVMLQLIQGRAPEHVLRIWVPGCSTGEEAYTVAMLVYEQLSEAGHPVDFQVFATDIDEAALAQARAGFYPASVAGDLSPERLDRFFVKEGEGFRVSSKLRDCMVFSVQNLIGDPPFSRLDLISCRNLLIYLEQEVQKKIMRLFHFALREGGHLILGNSESIGVFTDLFETVSKPCRLFRRIGPRRMGEVDFPILPRTGSRVVSPAMTGLDKPIRTIDLEQVVQRELVRQYAPASVLIDRRQSILYVSGDASPWLQAPSGVPTTDLYTLVREGLSTRLRGAIQRAMNEKTAVEIMNARVKRAGRYYPVELRVSPVEESEAGEGLMLVVFRDRVDAVTGEVEVVEVGSEEERMVKQLEGELKTLREELQSTVEEMDSSGEELKASNEEVMSMNEELQSSNEELETSKEELQSLNEELCTVNAQLQDKVLDLKSINNDLTNLVSSTEVAILFLDESGCIRRYTPAACEVLSVIDSDLGRPVRDIALRVNDAQFYDDIDEVLTRGKSCAREVRTEAGRWFRRRILPYRRAQEDAAHGVVVVFDDITVLKQKHAALSESERQKAGILDGLQEAVLLLTPDFKIEWVNQQAMEVFGVESVDVIGRYCYEVLQGASEPCADDCPPKASMKGGCACCQEKVMGDKVLQVSAMPLLDEKGKVTAVIESVLDITLQKNTQAVLEQQVEARTSELRAAKESIAESEAFLRRTGELARIGGWELCLKDRSMRWTETTRTIFDVEEAFVPTYERLLDFYEPAERMRIESAILAACEEGKPFDLEMVLNPGTGCVGWVRMVGEPEMKEGVCVRLSGSFQDITDRKLAQQEIDALARFPDENPNPVLRLALDGTVLYSNPASQRLLAMWSVGDDLKLSAEPKEWVLKAVEMSGKPFTTEVVVDDRVLHLCFAAIPEPGFVNVYGSDVTELQRSQEQVMQAEQRYQLALDAVSVGIWEWDLSRDLVEMNRRTLALVGLDPTQPVVKSAEIMKVIHPEDLPGVEQALRDHVEGRSEIYRKEFRFVLEDGFVRWIQGRGLAVERDAAGNALRIVGTCTDITREKQSEEEQIRIQNLESLGTLAGGIAHDFNNILMGVFGNISLAKMKLESEHAVYQLLEKAEKAMPRATKLTGQLLTFAKGGEPILDTVHLDELVEEVVRFDLMGSNVQPVFEHDENLWHGDVDKGQMQQVLSNLAINARDAMPGGGRLFVSLQNVELKKGALPGLDVGLYICITVQDEGVGIKAKHLNHLFDPYFTTKTLGNGLGLATVYSVVKRHGGGVFVESEEGRGATFTLYVPASDEQHDDSRHPLAGGPLDQLGSSMHALLMDDEEMIRLVVPRMLERDGIQTETVAGGDAAVELYQAALGTDDAFDFVILDLTIPGESGGQDVVRRLQEMDPEVRAIVASGYAGDAVVSDYEAFGFKSFVVKPFLRKDLLAAVQQVMKS